jgi:hypothetical protein
MKHVKRVTKAQEPNPQLLPLLSILLGLLSLFKLRQEQPL